MSIQSWNALSFSLHYSCGLYLRHLLVNAWQIERQKRINATFHCLVLWNFSIRVLFHIVKRQELTPHRILQQQQQRRKRKTNKNAASQVSKFNSNRSISYAIKRKSKWKINVFTAIRERKPKEKDKWNEEEKSSTILIPNKLPSHKINRMRLISSVSLILRMYGCAIRDCEPNECFVSKVKIAGTIFCLMFYLVFMANEKHTQCTRVTFEAPFSFRIRKAIFFLLFLCLSCICVCFARNI